MRKILYAWELGGGTGHLQKLAAIAAGMRERGFAAVVAARNVAAAERICAPLALDVVAAPVWSGRTRAKVQPRTFPEILSELGFLETDYVKGAITTWINLVRLTGCEAVVADYAPVAVLAARIAAIPCAATGTGFTLPPAVTPFPPLLITAGTTKADLGRVESRVLASVNRALKGLRQRPLGTLAEMLACDRTYLATFPELDHYGRRNGSAYRGVFDTGRASVHPQWPDGGGQRLFVYYHDRYDSFGKVVDAIAGLGMPTLLVAPGASPPVARSAVRRNVNVCIRPVDLREVARQADVTVTHGGHGAVAELLRQGSRIVIVPYFNEQRILSVRLAKRGLAVDAKPGGEDVAKRVRMALDDDRLGERVAEFSARYKDWTPDTCLQRILDDLSDLVG